MIGRFWYGWCAGLGNAYRFELDRPVFLEALQSSFHNPDGHNETHVKDAPNLKLDKLTGIMEHQDLPSSKPDPAKRPTGEFPERTT